MPKKSKCDMVIDHLFKYFDDNDVSVEDASIALVGAIASIIGVTAKNKADAVEGARAYAKSLVTLVDTSYASYERKRANRTPEKHRSH